MKLPATALSALLVGGEQSGLSAAGGLSCGGPMLQARRELALRGPRSLQGKPTGYCTAFVCLVTQLLVIEKFHRSGAGQAR